MFPVLVAPNLVPSLILGMDFLRSFEITINFADMSCRSDSGSTAEFCALATEHDLAPEYREAVGRIHQRLAKLSEPDADGKLRATNLMVHEIRLKPGTLPIKQPVRPVSGPIRQALHEELDKLIQQGIVEPSQSPWCSPLVLQKKKNGSLRLCFDGRKLNQVTEKDSYPLPHIHSTLDMLKGAKFISSIDLKSAFHQIELSEESKPLTAFAVPGRGLWQYKRVVFGGVNSAAAFQRLCDAVIAGIDNVFGYLDDLILVSRTAEEHIALLNSVIDRLERANLTINAEKCELFRSSLLFLGFIVDSEGLRASPDKIAAIVDFPRMKTQREVRRFLGLCGYYRRFVPNFSKVASPLTDLLRKGRKFTWSLECEQAFARIKTLLTNAPVMAVPNFDLPFFVQTDASGEGLGAVLTQKFPDGEKVIAYTSRKLNKLERSYSATELECLSVIHAIQRWRMYLEGCHFTVITDHHALRWLKELKDPNPRLTRWALKLQSYDYEIEYRKGSLNKVPDALSRAPVSPACAFQLIPDQVIDPWYLRMMQNVTSNPDAYPLWKTEGGLLYKFLADRDELVNTWKLVVPKEQRNQLLDLNHATPSSGHFGVFKTLKRIAAEFYWPKMRRDVQSFVAKCSVCAAFKTPTTKPAGTMGRHHVSRPWELIAMDFTGKYPRSPRRNEYMLSVQCLFTKFILLFPMTNCRVANLVKLLEDKVFCVYGVPSGIVCDNGAQFTSRQFTQLMQDKNVQVRYTALYHPQADPVERAHRELKRMMGSFMQGHQSHARWDEYLPQFQLAINSSVNEATGFAPASIFFNHRMCAANRDLAGEFVDIDAPQAAVQANKDRIAELHPQVQRNIDRQFLRNKKRYDAGRNPHSYQIGDLVWHRTFPQSSAVNKLSKKLSPKFVGPFRIVARHGNVVYSLEDRDGAGVGKWHIQDLLPDRTEESEEDSSSEESE
uniref:RNA-directed DNA polymerase n=1 Tax=Lygus hesperus TaxID=30085 RepID=A0A146LKA7_LYGHE